MLRNFGFKRADNCMTSICDDNLQVLITKRTHQNIRNSEIYASDSKKSSNGQQILTDVAAPVCIFTDIVIINPFEIVLHYAWYI